MFVYFKQFQKFEEMKCRNDIDLEKMRFKPTTLHDLAGRSNH